MSEETGRSCAGEGSNCLRYGRSGRNSRMRGKLKTVWNGVTTVIAALAVLLAVTLVGVRLAGLKPFTVLSGSMEPACPVGSLIFVKNVDYRQLQAGDVITFLVDEGPVATHRIVEVVADETDPSILRYRTKGDANDFEDGSPVHYKNIIGKLIFVIPYLGYAANYIQNPPGMYIAIAAGALLTLLALLPDLFADNSRKTEKTRRKKKYV